MTAIDPGYARLTEPFLIPHDYACRMWGCRRPIDWIDLRPGVGLGYCDDHRTRAATIPIGIYGREGESWQRYPGSLAAYLARWERERTR